jgi:hypothetical protein
MIFGQYPPPVEEDKVYNQPCERKHLGEAGEDVHILQCPLNAFVADRDSVTCWLSLICIAALSVLPCTRRLYQAVQPGHCEQQEPQPALP